MRSRAIQRLVSAVEAAHGGLSLYGCAPDEEHGICFTIGGAPATFSVHTQDGALPPNRYDVQIEGTPPGEYVFTALASLEELLSWIDRTKGPMDSWPS